MRRTVLAVLVAIVTVGCGGLLDPRIRITSDFAGRRHPLGSTIQLEWECEECDSIAGTTVVVELVEEGGNSPLGRVAIGPLSGHAKWNTATTTDGRRVEPGRYKLFFSTNPKDEGTNGAGERRMATGVSGTFNLTP
jgi:hypothetical protein